MRRFAVYAAALLAAALLPVVATTAPASAATIWTTIASGTTEDITAVDYVGPGDIVYATAGGKIFRNGVQQAGFAGNSFTDIAMSPAGNLGVATAANGKIYYFSGTTWGSVTLSNKSFDHQCGGVGPFPAYTPTGNFNAVTYVPGLPDTAYVVGDDRGLVLKIVGGVATEVSRKADGSCKADAGSSDRATDIQAVTDQLIYITTTNFGRRLIASDAFTSSAAIRPNSAINCPGSRSRIGIDLTNTSKSFVIGGCDGRLSFGFSSDSATTYDVGLDYLNNEGDTLTGMNDVSVAGGSALAVGNGGAIVVSVDGRNAYLQRAAGAEQTTDWLAVDKLTGTAAVVVGKGGKLVTTNAATTTFTPAPVPTPPPVPVGSTIVVTTTLAGGTISLTTPRFTCVPKGTKLKAKVNSKKKRGAPFKGIASVQFALGGKKLGTLDKKKPFITKVDTKKLTSGKTYKLKAKVKATVTRGPSPSKTLKTVFTIC